MGGIDIKYQCHVGELIFLQYHTMVSDKHKKVTTADIVQCTWVHLFVKSVGIDGIFFTMVYKGSSSHFLSGEGR